MKQDKDQTAAGLLARMAPVLDPHIWVYACLPPGQACPSGLSPLMTCRETEGLTLVLTEDEARSVGLAARFPCRLITLTVPSDLEAVGFIAAIAPALADQGISCNVVAGFHHDHLLVPAERAQDAMAALDALSRSNSIDDGQDRP
ncbi:MAG: hypothetical protein CMF75_01860 [Maricaulis sp.]|nr:hypothetical protein [Maricaulis sp.]